MKEQLKEFGKDFGTGAAVFVAALIIISTISFYTEFGEQAGTVASVIGYGVAFFGVHAMGKKIRAKFFKKGE